ncbi:hypothetical protein Ppa06_38680 [Planomonospora parontospora subsp. parontospora]|uniref:DUF418 domain-containing protein n=2 Tax=Planomonospora parontospora TaxID=58119 RepID=A0AA37BIJ5_9ACTN|nr:DUF418 domain-containing protein [Planomonospora parontospora]GGK76903.1 hypothetical protein GCM10010126_40230 [Planomonospora parontospora]GII10070.1 hypothetical protein Ppa06_38680 [Planomonospora parontospora subsp. parontospora]
MSVAPLAPVHGATPLARRAPAPDLARGLMLLLIALAHAHMYLSGHETGFRGYALDGGALDRLVAGVQILLVDGRALPMFAALFGYGLVQLADRQLAAGRGWPQVRGVLRRRSLWLLAFGFCHALLLFFGDILGAYGLIGLVFVGFVRREDRAVLRAAAAGLVLHVVVLSGFGLLTVSAPKGDTPAAMADPIEATVMRLIGWAGMTPTYFAAGVVPAFLLGIWAARRRLLEDPLPHRDLLVRVALAGAGLAVAGGLPLMLIDTRLWTPSDPVAVSAYVLHSTTGIAGGLAYAAVIALAVGRMRRGYPGPVVRALAACGQWSLTCYLLQSVIFVAVFAPYAGGLGTRVGDAAASGIAVAAWLATVVLAALAAPGGRRGPAEAALRRLTYGRR